jgi:uncharacterized protein YjbI with pentapeptide repeats
MRDDNITEVDEREWTEEATHGTGPIANVGSPAIDAAILGVMVEALRQYEAAKNLNQEILEDICIEAFSAGKLNDFDWLEKKLSEVLGDEVSLERNEDQTSDQSLGPVDASSRDASSRDALERIHISPKSEVRSEADMKEIIRLHEVWMNSVLNPRAEISAYRANLSETNLSGFDLVGANLSCADFRKATMIGTNLRSANLANAWLQGANLQGANLAYANLKRAKLDGADLRDADLTGVDLESADFSKALLKGQGPS